MTSKYYIATPLSNSEIENRSKKIYPIKIQDNLDAIEVEPPKCLYNIAYLWDSKPVRKLGKIATNNKDISISYGPPTSFGGRNIKSFWKGIDFPTYHTYNYHGFFKPTLAEVISQLPAALFEDFDHMFVTTKYLEMVGEFHVGVTTIFIPYNVDSEYYYLKFNRLPDWQQWQSFIDNEDKK